MQMQKVALAGVAALVLAAIFAISPNANSVANEVSTEVSGIDISLLTGGATNLPEQQFPAH